MFPKKVLRYAQADEMADDYEEVYHEEEVEVFGNEVEGRDDETTAPYIDPKIALDCLLELLE